jgi:acetoin:2,6-dichlorophenolindophenol oxidoreductase subunit alpha
MNDSQRTNDLGTLSDPTLHQEPIDCSGKDPDYLLLLLRSMLTIRKVEETIADLTLAGEAACPCHLGIGQEACAVGISAALRNADRVFGAHRSHSHFLALGGTPRSILLEVLGKYEGASHGMGGSMHLIGENFGFFGSVPIVAGTIPLALGAGLAAKMDRKGDVAVSYFGDGASEEGTLHESLNFAAQFNVPVLFVCENNLYSSHLDIAQRQPSDSIARFADAHRIENRILDGNDVLAIASAAHSIVSGMRANPRPGFLELVTYRWRGHVGADENIDVGVRRSAEELAMWKKRDPISRLAAGIDWQATRTSLDEIESSVENEITEALDYARRADYPPLAFNNTVVYDA